MRPRRRTSEQEIGHIRACHQQHDGDDPHQHRKCGPASASDRALMIWGQNRDNVSIRRRAVIRRKILALAPSKRSGAPVQIGIGGSSGSDSWEKRIDQGCDRVAVQTDGVHARACGRAETDQQGSRQADRHHRARRNILQPKWKQRANEKNHQHERDVSYRQIVPYRI